MIPVRLLVIFLYVLLASRTVDAVITSKLELCPLLSTLVAQELANVKAYKEVKEACVSGVERIHGLMFDGKAPYQEIDKLQAFLSRLNPPGDVREVRRFVRIRKVLEPALRLGSGHFEVARLQRLIAAYSRMADAYWLADELTTDHSSLHTRMVFREWLSIDPSEAVIGDIKQLKNETVAWCKGAVPESESSDEF